MKTQTPESLSSRNKVLRTVATVLGMAIIVGFIAFGDGRTVEANNPFGWILVLPLWTGPFLLYLFLVRSRWASVVGGLGLLIATFLLLLSIYRNEHSTAVLGLLFAPPLVYAAIGMVLHFERRSLARSPSKASPGRAE